MSNSNNINNANNINKQASLFFRNVSVVDHGYVDDMGRIIGGSYFPNVTIKGKVTSDENVVIDFSKGKSLIKQAFDDIMDHKVWIIEDYSQAVTKEDTKNPNNYIISTPAVVSSLPKWRVFQMKKTDTFSSLIQDYLKQHGLDVIVEVEMTENTFSTQNNNTFRYTHGLKNSSSLGCKNPNHGHLSFIELIGPNEYQKLKVKNQIINDLNEVIFIYDDNIVYEDDDIITISYSVNDEYFENVYWKDCNKIIISNEETTAENLINLIYEMYKDELQEAEITQIYLSEGLQKGSVLNLK